MVKFNVSALLAVILISASAAQGATTKKIKAAAKPAVVAPSSAAPATTSSGAGAGAAPSSPTSKPQAAAGSAGYSAPPTDVFDPINLSPPSLPAGPQGDCGACLNFMSLASKGGANAPSASKDAVGKFLCNQEVLNSYEGCVKCSSDMALTITAVLAPDVISSCAPYKTGLTVPSDNFSSFKATASNATTTNNT